MPISSMSDFGSTYGVQLPGAVQQTAAEQYTIIPGAPAASPLAKKKPDTVKATPGVVQTPQPIYANAPPSGVDAATGMISNTAPQSSGMDIDMSAYAPSEANDAVADSMEDASFTSDRRVKHNIRPLHLEKLQAMLWALGGK